MVELIGSAMSIIDYCKLFVRIFIILNDKISILSPGRSVSEYIDLGYVNCKTLYCSSSLTVIKSSELKLVFLMPSNRIIILKHIDSIMLHLVPFIHL